MAIRFGTSGWRAVVADEFAFVCVAMQCTLGWPGGVARSVATSQLVDRVAEARGLPVYEAPVGFKFIGELINEDKTILGGEESAGLSVKGHYPEKDGVLACLLAAEAVASRRESLTQQLTNTLRARRHSGNPSNRCAAH
jgi:phosphomannomutase